MEIRREKRPREKERERGKKNKQKKNTRKTGRKQERQKDSVMVEASKWIERAAPIHIFNLYSFTCAHGSEWAVLKGLTEKSLL